MKKKTITLELLEPMLGTVPLDKEIYQTYIESKKPKKNDEDESENIMEEKNSTGFHEDENGKFIYDYMIKGFFKAACSALRRVTGSPSNKLTAYKKIINGLVFVSPRKIYIDTQGGDFDVIERPLRASTPKGDRVALASSVTAPKGSLLKLELTILGGISDKLLKDWLDYGSLKGLGQWRNASYGRFSWREE